MYNAVKILESYHGDKKNQVFQSIIIITWFVTKMVSMRVAR